MRSLSRPCLHILPFWPDCAWVPAQVPNVARKEYSLLDITDDGFVRTPTPVPQGPVLQDAL